MQRVFQHYEGEITELRGLRFSQVKAFVATEDNDIVLLWCKVESNNIWYRIFIDGVYCGVDKYFEDESINDLDECIYIDDHSQEFQAQKVLTADVINRSDKCGTIDLIITFEEGTLQLQCLWDVGICKLIISQNNL